MKKMIFLFCLTILWFAFACNNAGAGQKKIYEAEDGNLLDGITVLGGHIRKRREIPSNGKNRGGYFPRRCQQLTEDIQSASDTAHLIRTTPNGY